MYYQRNKWTTAKSTYYNDYRYDSKFEASQAQEYDLLKKAGEIKDWEAQKTLDLICNGYKVGTYRIDFVVYHHDGTIELSETKGFATQIWKMKWKILETMVNSNSEYLQEVFGKDKDIKMTLIQQKSNWSYRKPKKY